MTMVVNGHLPGETLTKSTGTAVVVNGPPFRGTH